MFSEVETYVTLSADLISSIRLVRKIRLIRRSDIAAIFAVHSFTTSGVKAQAHCKTQTLGRFYPEHGLYF